MTALTVRGLSRRFGRTTVLDHLDMQLAPGERFVLLGASGSGKSTALRLIAGHDRPDAGDVHLDGASVLGVPPERRGVGMVFQAPLLFPHLTVRENVAFGPRMQGLSRPDTRARVEEMLRRTQLESQAALRPHQLSGGQAQRAALARALAARPRVLLLDEPFSALDAPLRQALRAWLVTLLDDSGTTSVFVTHDQEEAFAVGQRLGVLHAGRLAQVGAPAELYGRPLSAAVAHLLGPATLLPGLQEGRTVRTALGVLQAMEARHGPVTVLLRPEDLRPGERFTATVERVVFAGDHLRATVECAGQRLLAQLPAHHPARSGEVIGLEVPPVWTFPT